MTEKVLAPVVNADVMWRLSADEFNKWRRIHDYPRIFEFLKNHLFEFKLWMCEQKLTDDDLYKYRISSFLKDEEQLFIYDPEENAQNLTAILSNKFYSTGALVNKFFKVKSRKIIIPYKAWFRKKFNKEPRSPEITSKDIPRRICTILNGLDLLDLGNCDLDFNHTTQSKDLDFVNISDLRVSNYLTSGGSFNIAFGSAVNLSIEGNFLFVRASNTDFCELWNQHSTGLKLSNGTFQSWAIENCDVHLVATSATLHLWNFVGLNFTAILSNSDIRDCVFSNSKIQYPIHIGQAYRLHAHIKRLYSQLGKKKEASRHYYQERKFERLAFLHPNLNFREEFFGAIGANRKGMVRFKFYLKYIYSTFLYLLWGYGEKPARVFFISIVLIIFFAGLYCFVPTADTQTYHNIFNSLYYSLVTFTTLGYGDISQANEFLRLCSGVEALSGMTFWGILIAGFTSNAKDY